MGVVHRDIKPENWLYLAQGRRHLKAIDFGALCPFKHAALARCRRMLPRNGGRWLRGCGCVPAVMLAARRLTCLPPSPACAAGLSSFFREGVPLTDLVGSPFYMAPEVGGREGLQGVAVGRGRAWARLKAALRQPALGQPH